jgi:hypothetical protein
MANPHRGEVSFEANGKIWTLRYSANALCALEAELDRGILDIAAEMQSWGPPLGADGKPLDETADQVAARARRVRLSFVRALFWAGLTEDAPHLTLAHAGDLMTEIGGLQVAVSLVVDAFAKAFPDAETKDARPRKPGQAGAGLGLNS